MLNKNIYVRTILEFGETEEQIVRDEALLFSALSMIDNECIVICTPNISALKPEVLKLVKESLGNVANRLESIGKIVKSSTHIDTESEQGRINKEMYLALVHSITRAGVDFSGFNKFINESDFFYAPATTRGADAVIGGLCNHSLNVYFALNNLIRTMGLENCFSQDTIKIVSLFHDISKINTFERTSINKKVYSNAGSKIDDLGRFDWVSEPGYKLSESDNRFVYGTRGQNSEYLIGAYVPMSIVESSAIINHLGGKDILVGYDSTPEIFAHYPLAVLLHSADLLSTYIQ